MNNLTIHPETLFAVEAFVKQPSHALILIAPEGMGKGTLADSLVCRLLSIDAARSNHSVQVILPDDKGTISIDAVRKLQRFLRLKTIGQNTIRRAVIIEDADTLTAEAQNALLKSLEEPPTDTIIVLTCKKRQALLPTITSRAQELQVRPPKPQDLKARFMVHYPANEVDRAFLLSGGAPGLMAALLSGVDHPLQQSVETAKQLLKASAFERLAHVEQLNKDKTEIKRLLEAVQRIAEVSLAQAAAKKNTKALKQWHLIRKHTLAAEQAIMHNANPKLVLVHFLLHI